MSDHKETPIQEAISIVTILAFFIGVGCFVGAMNTAADFISSALLCGYLGLRLVPGTAPAPLSATSGAVGFFVWVLGCCFATYIANWLSAGELANIDKQTARLKKNRAKIQANRRAKDGFDVR
jgi:hypothetical protein